MHLYLRIGAHSLTGACVRKHANTRVQLHTAGMQNMRDPYPSICFSLSIIHWLLNSNGFRFAPYNAEQNIDSVHLLYYENPSWCSREMSNFIYFVLVATIDAQWEGMGDVGSARYEPALHPPCPTIRVLSYSNCIHLMNCFFLVRIAWS